ncbi:MAG: tetratricopeptide repeat protein [Bdellovibrionota bacterium]
MVRTRMGEILGPYLQAQLLEEMGKNTFSPDDEIAPSQGAWISAQALVHRDTDEFTQTMTKSRAVTESVSVTPTATTGSHAFTNSQSNAALKLVTEDPQPYPQNVQQPVQNFPQQPVYKSAGRNFVRPLIVLIVAGSLVWVALFRKSEQTSDAPSSSRQSLPPVTTESPFLREVQQLIKLGQRKVALDKLRTYHQKRKPSNDVAYQVPYAALLITEGESIPRAKKLLEQLVESKAAPNIRAEANLWLGYIKLSQDIGDFGANHFQETLQIDPKNAAARFNLGRAYLKQEKYKKALEYFQFAELEAPDMWLIHIYKGRARAALSDMQEARFAFMTAVQTAEDRWLNYIYFSLFLVGIREPLAAQNTLQKMLARDPHYEINSPPPLGFYQEPINYDEYEGAFMEVMKSGSRKLQQLGKTYISYLKNGPNSPDGERLLRMAEKGDLTSRVLALKVQLDNNASPSVLSKALLTLPANLSEFGYYAYLLRGEAELRVGRIQEAEEDFKRALLLEPKSAIGRLTYASFLKRTNHVEEAEAEIRNLLNFHPNYIPALEESLNF